MSISAAYTLESLFAKQEPKDRVFYNPESDELFVVGILTVAGLIDYVCGFQQLFGITLVYLGEL